MTNEELKKRQQEAIAKLMRGEIGPDVSLNINPSVDPNISNVQTQPKVEIENSPLDFKNTTTGIYTPGVDVSNPLPRQLYQSNVDKVIDTRIDPELALATSRESAALSQRDETRNRQNEMIERLLQRPENDPTQVIRDMRAMSASRPQEFQVPQEDIWSKAIASLGPALAGLAVGGYAGHRGGGEGGEKSMALYADQRKQDVANAARMAEERSKRMVGQSQLAQAEAKILQDVEKEHVERLEKGINYLEKQGQQDTDLYKMMVQERNKMLIGEDLLKASKDIGDFREKELQREADIQKAQIGADSKKVAAKIRSNQAQNKPLTESQAKATFQYSMASQAENDLKQIRKTYGNYPSMDSRLFPTFKELSVGEYTDIAAALSSPSIPAPVREQIQSELLFLESIGRIQSGAAIGSNEWRKFEAQYFPRKGDNETTTQRKEIARQRALQAMGVMSGKGMNQVPPVQQVELKKDAQPKEMIVKGTKYILQPNGKYLPEKK